MLPLRLSGSCLLLLLFFYSSYAFEGPTIFSSNPSRHSLRLRSSCRRHLLPCPSCPKLGVFRRLTNNPLVSCMSMTSSCVNARSHVLQKANIRLWSIFAMAAITLLLTPSSAFAASLATATDAVVDPRRVIALLFASGAIGMWAEQYTRIGAVISGAMVTFFVAMLFSASGLLPAATTHPVYTAVWENVVPVAIVQTMLCLDRNAVKQALGQSGSMLYAFGIASLGTFVGSIVACGLVRIQDGWQLASVFCATYIGGTLNFIATAEAIGLRDPAMLATSFSADMLMMAIYFSGLFFLARKVDAREDKATTSKGKQDKGESDIAPLPTSAMGLVGNIAIASIIVWVGYAAASMTGGMVSGVPIVTGIALAVSTFVPDRVRTSWGDAPQLFAALCTQTFFATIGASTDVTALLASGAILQVLAFVAVLLAVHAVILDLFGRRLAHLHPKDLLLASNAAVGGSATASAMASSMKWTSRASPAVLCGTLGYAVGTYAGILAGMVCKRLFL